ncbi:MAG: TonB-dependent receptor [Vicinamibacterales bacterium]
MRHLLITMALLVACAADCLAFEGRVIDERTGLPIANAEVSILGLTGSVRTDADGRFSWRPNPAPPFEVLVILPGGAVAKPVLIESVDWSATLTIRVSSTIDEDVTVAGAAPSIDASPAAGMTLLTGREIAIRSPENLVQALENVAGVAQISEGHAAVPAVRGLAAGRTLILLDGARVNSERRAGVSATYLDPNTLDGIDVARGPGSVAYGSDAFGGVISARTRRPELAAPLHFRFHAAAGAGVPEQRLSAEVSKGSEKSAALAQVHWRKAGDWRSPEGAVFNSGWRDAGFLLRSMHVAGASQLSLGWQSDFGADIERPRNNSRVVRFFYPAETSHRLTATLTRDRLGVLGRSSINAMMGRYANVTDQDRFATDSRPRSVERADVSARDYQLRATAERGLARAKIEFGVDLNGRFGLEALDIAETYDMAGALTATRVNTSVDAAGRHSTGLFLQAEAALMPRMFVSGGGRFDRTVTRNRGGFFGDRSTANTAFSGLASITAGPFSGLTLTGQIARGFRDPVLSDRYFRGPSGRGFITGNPDLEPETSLQVDGAARYTSGRIRLALYGYRYALRDLIERFGNGDSFFFRNRGQAVIRGGEIEMQAALPRDVTVELSAQIARGEDADTNAALDSIAPATFSALIRKHFGTRAYAQLRGALFSDDDRPGPTEREVNGYGVIDVGGGARLTRQLELRGQIRNLLDATYFASQDTRAVLAPGRTASVTAVLTF